MLSSRRALARCGAACVFLFVCTILVKNTCSSVFTHGPSHCSRPLTHKVAEVPPTPTPSPSPRVAAPIASLQNLSRFDSYGLGAAECSAEFKDLFKEIEHAVAHRKSIGNVTKADISIDWIDDAAVRAMIYRQKLYILEAKLKSVFHPPRALAILQQIDRAITSSPEPIPDIEFSFVVEDRPVEDRPVEDQLVHGNQTTWGLTRRPIDAQVWLMPDFGYFSWPNGLIGAYEQIRTEMAQNARPFDVKIPKLFWRGALWTNEIRTKLIEATRGRFWADVEEIKWMEGGIEGTPLSTVDHCNYQFLMQTEGRSYSGRGKYLFNCGSVVVMHTPEWIEPHHSVLIPSGDAQNVVMVDRNLTDLETKMKALLADPVHGKAIAANSASTFRDRFLTPAAQACYWRALFRAWAGVSFVPEPFDVLTAGGARLRGVPWETFVLNAAIPPPEPPKPKKCRWWKKIVFSC